MLFYHHTPPATFPCSTFSWKIWDLATLLHIFSDAVYVQSRRGRRCSKHAHPHFRAATISDQWGMNPSKIIQGLLFPQVLALSRPPLTQDCLEESMFKGEHEKTGGISPLPWLSTDTLKHQWRKRYTNNALETEKISKTLEMQGIKQ